MVYEPNKNTLEWWDNLNNLNFDIVPAIGGIDAHALKIKKFFIPFTIFPYKTLFKTITNVLNFDKPLPEDFSLRKKEILNAIKSGNNLIVNRTIQNDLPEIFIEPEQKMICGGKNYKLTKDLSIRVQNKHASEIKVVYNGKEIYKKFSTACNIKLEKAGKYRVEIKQRNRGFAYTNPIVVY